MQEARCSVGCSTQIGLGLENGPNPRALEPILLDSGTLNKNEGAATGEPRLNTHEAVHRIQCTHPHERPGSGGRRAYA